MQPVLVPLAFASDCLLWCDSITWVLGFGVQRHLQGADRWEGRWVVAQHESHMLGAALG